MDRKIKPAPLFAHDAKTSRTAAAKSTPCAIIAIKVADFSLKPLLSLPIQFTAAFSSVCRIRGLILR
jgi:hypothetical protein